MAQEEVKKSHKGKLISIIFFIILLIALLFIYAKYVGIKGLIVKEYKIESNILTSNFSGIKIVHFSDLLYKSTTNKEDIKNLVSRINELKPDIVVFTGDLIDKKKNEYNLLINTLKLVNPLGILEKGYSLATINDKVIKSSNDVNIGDLINVKLHEGAIKAKVVEK